VSRDVATPLMQQYREIKSRHQDAILFFRMGDFYEMFFDDAELASRVLGLTLTSRNNGGAAEVPLAGLPVKAAGDYLRRLVQQGYRVAICEQVEDPRTAKGIVRREVIETITPGAAFADDLLDGERNNFLCAISGGDSRRTRPMSTDNDYGARRVAVAAVDVSTGEVRLALCRSGDAEALLARLAPRELLVPRAITSVPGSEASVRSDGALVTEREAWEFDAELGREDLARHYGVASLDGLGIGPDDGELAGAMGALLRYLHELQPAGVPHLARPVIDRGGETIPLDEMTRRNLELVESLRGADESGTLLAVLDRTLTPMGKRLLRHWILAPLATRGAIDARLDSVGACVRDPIARQRLREALDGVRDIERLGSKAAAGRATPREMGTLGASIARLPQIADALRALDPRGAIARILERWDDCGDMATEVGSALVDRPPPSVGDDETIRPGFDAELDELRALRDGGKDGIAAIQAGERMRTGIHSLKVGYNKVFGYYIEVTNANQHLVPADFQRRQTLAGAERYVTPALKDYEERVLTAVDRIATRERQLFEALRASVGRQVARLQCVAGLVAELDVLTALAEAAEREGYVRPTMTEGFDLDIRGGRHPVVERMMPREKFIPNDVRLTDDGRVIILTGPNMAGKSTILRQVGLIVLMAHVGSFVPASAATIGLVDRVFTRVGASDNLVRGQSTFMVEMSETSAILHTATPRSLVLLDEIGRGTSTYDGVAIAWAVTEHLHDRTRCKTMFATHYHELTQLADELVSVRNYNVGVREVGEQILFLHRLQPGGADRSYGIEVGRLAGLPAEVLRRAKAVLTLLEGEQLVPRLRGDAPVPPPAQLGLFADTPDPVVARLRDLDIERMTPLQALGTLAELAVEARRKPGE
jgi:DNA mismatch repair protein MutS